MKRKKMGKREREKGKREGGGARQRRPRPRSATRGVRAAGGGARGQEGMEEKGEREKEGRDSRRPIATRRVGWGKMGRGLKSGVGLLR